MREKLNNEFYITVPELLKKQVSKKDGTAKYLWRIQGDDMVECVLMQYSHGDTVCISTQVGCRMGCTFCASSLDGFKRNLTASEMLDQVIFTGLDAGKRISNVVLMGIGEPLDNFDNVMRFIRLICHPSGINIGARRLTLSTCGIIENIDRLAEYDVQLTLAISLHAPDDETRSFLMPLLGGAGVNELMEAGKRYYKTTGRRVTYEYAIIDGVNDSTKQAESLSLLLKDSASHLNLLLMSDVRERALKPGKPENVKAFIDILDRNSVNYTKRRSLGADIDASCGQLRRRALQGLK
jgi:23S rRNA (adenine2503-C2)-methyltransferase